MPIELAEVLQLSLDLVQRAQTAEARVKQLEAEVDRLKAALTQPIPAPPEPGA